MLDARLVWAISRRLGAAATIDSCFKLFDIIHACVLNTDQIARITKEVGTAQHTTQSSPSKQQLTTSLSLSYPHQMLLDFAADNVSYVEFRSTPRDEASSGMTMESYVETVLDTVHDCATAGIPVTARFLLSINRTEPM